MGRAIALLLACLPTWAGAQQVCDDRIPGHFPDRFIDRGDGTVLDRATDLVWQRCDLGQTWSGSGCRGYPERLTWQEPCGTRAPWRASNIGAPPPSFAIWTAASTRPGWWTSTWGNRSANPSTTPSPCVWSGRPTHEASGVAPPRLDPGRLRRNGPWRCRHRGRGGPARPRRATGPQRHRGPPTGPTRTPPSGGTHWPATIATVAPVSASANWTATAAPFPLTPRPGTACVTRSPA